MSVAEISRPTFDQSASTAPVFAAALLSRPCYSGAMEARTWFRIPAAPVGAQLEALLEFAAARRAHYPNFLLVEREPAAPDPRAAELFATLAPELVTETRTAIAGRARPRRRPPPTPWSATTASIATPRWRSPASARSTPSSRRCPRILHPRQRQDALAGLLGAPGPPPPAPHPRGRAGSAEDPPLAAAPARGCSSARIITSSNSHPLQLHSWHANQFRLHAKDPSRTWPLRSPTPTGASSSPTRPASPRARSSTAISRRSGSRIAAGPPTTSPRSGSAWPLHPDLHARLGPDRQGHELGPGALHHLPRQLHRAGADPVERHPGAKYGIPFPVFARASSACSAPTCPRSCARWWPAAGSASRPGSAGGLEHAPADLFSGWPDCMGSCIRRPPPTGGSASSPSGA